ncbi:MAG: hypothetical protein K0R52_85 [Alphaproteobacteria bacterium]|jgi:Tfp pilus assembly protein PilF|nr:hypothetical protein [Alphaproteobacteria bacterium]
MNQFYEFFKQGLEWIKEYYWLFSGIILPIFASLYGASKLVKMYKTSQKMKGIGANSTLTQASGDIQQAENHVQQNGLNFPSIIGDGNSVNILMASRETISGTKNDIKSDLQEEKTIVSPTENSSIDFKYHIEMFEAAYKEKLTYRVIEIAEKWKVDSEKTFDDEFIERQKYGLLQQLGYDYIEEELKQIEKNNLSWFFPSLQLSVYYLELSSFEKAEVHAKEALNRAEQDPNYLSQALINYADFIFKKDNSIEAAIAYLYQYVNNRLLGDTCAVSLYQKLSDLHETKGDIEGKHHYLEKALQIDPGNKKIRFDLALSYSNYKVTKINAIYHYEKLLIRDPLHTSAMNNMAIIYSEINQSYEKDMYLTKAIKAKDSFSRGNQIINLINMGFFHLAQKLYDEAPNEQKEDEKLKEAIGYLKDKIDKYKQDAKILESRKGIYYKYKERHILGKYIDIETKNLEGKWVENKTISITLKVEHENKVVGMLEDTTQEPNSLIEGSYLYGKLSLHTDIKQTYKAAGLLGSTLMGEKTPAYQRWYYMLFPESQDKLIGIKWYKEFEPTEIVLERQ